MSTQDCLKVVEDYFCSLEPLIKACGDSIPSGIFELNTSRSPGFSRMVLMGGHLENTNLHYYSWLKFIPTAARQILKWLAIILLSKFYYRNRKRHEKELRETDAVFVGFGRKQNNKLVPKDFVGLVDSKQFKTSKTSFVSLRLTNVSFRDYFSLDPNTIPILGYVKLSTIFSALIQQKKLIDASRVCNQFSNTVIHETILSDFESGHAVSSYVIGHTIASLLNATLADSCEVHFPFERHDWEQLSMYSLRKELIICWVQSCTFSPQDLNMYQSNSGPAYRKAIADKIYVLSDKWKSVIQKNLLIDTNFHVLESNRFSGTTIRLTFNDKSNCVAYIASINRKKVEKDLEVLSNLGNSYSVDVRLHPSLKDIELPPNVKLNHELDGEYKLCVFADTSMVFQLDNDPKRLVFIVHDSIPNQNPTKWFSESHYLEICAKEFNAFLSL